MTNAIQPFHLLVIALAVWLNRQQQAVIDYLIEENRVLKDQLEGQRLRFTDEQRIRLAVKAKALGRQLLDEIETIVTSIRCLPGIARSSRRSGPMPGRGRVDLASRKRSPIWCYAWRGRISPGATTEFKARSAISATSLVRQAKLGASCRVQVPVGRGIRLISRKG